MGEIVLLIFEYWSIPVGIIKLDLKVINLNPTVPRFVLFKYASKDGCVAERP